MSESKQLQFHTPELNAKVGLETIRGIKIDDAIGLEPDVENRSGAGGGAMILDKYLSNEEHKKSGTEVVKESLASDARAEESANAGQR